MHQADGSIGLRYPRPVSQPSSPGRRNKARVATWNLVTFALTGFWDRTETDEMRLSCVLCNGTRNLNGSKHGHYATSLDSDDLTVLSPSAPSNHGIGPRSFPPRTAFGTDDMISCTIAA